MVFKDPDWKKAVCGLLLLLSHFSPVQLYATP